MLCRIRHTPEETSFHNNNNTVYNINKPLHMKRSSDSSSSDNNDDSWSRDSNQEERPRSDKRQSTRPVAVETLPQPPPRQENRELNVIHHDLSGVNNQFKMKGGERACIAISVLVLFHLYRRATSTDPDEVLLPDIEEWNALLKRGIALYDVWLKGLSVRPSDEAGLFPTIEEVLSLEECHHFTALFSPDEPPMGQEVSGLVRRSKKVESTEGSLAALFIQMRRDASRLGRPVCALVVIPVAVCVSVLCKPEPPGKDCTFFCFDSHGGKGGRAAVYCELTQFFMANDIARYLIHKYSIDSIASLDPYCMAFCTEEEIVASYGFHARVFK